MQAIKVGIAPSDAIRQIAAAATQNQLVLFIGAGLSRNAGLPDWRGLLSPAAEELGGWDQLSGYSLPFVAEAYQRKTNRRALLDLVKKPIDRAITPSKVHELLAALNPEVIFTTNFDRLLERTFPEAKVVASPGNAADVPRGRLSIFHIHGHIDHLGADTDGLILTEKDYREVITTKRAFLEQLKRHWHESLILFIGYGGGDEDLKAQASAIQNVFGKAHTKRHLSIDLSGNSTEAIIQAQWEPLQADVILGRDLTGDIPAEKLSDFLNQCANQIQKTLKATQSPSDEGAIIVSSTALKVQKSTAAPWEFQTPSQIPTDLPDFVGRESLIKSLEEHLLADDVSATGIWGVQGMGGVGKSALAVRIVNRLSRTNSFPDGYLWIRVGERPLMEILNQCWIDLGGPTDSTTSFNEISLKTILRRVWLGRRMLVVLDNCDRAEQIPQFLDAFNGHAILVTSRTQCDLVGWFSVDCMDSADSLKLLRKICPRLSRESDSALEHLAIDRLGGLPLALRLAGTWLNTSARRSVAEYLKLLDQEGLALLSRPAGTVPGFSAARVQDIRACFALSVNSLSDDHLKVFALVALIEGHDFPAKLANQWVNQCFPSWSSRDCDDALDALIAASLLEMSSDDRFKMHALLREYGRIKISDLPLADKNAGRFAELLIQAIKDSPALKNGLAWASHEYKLIEGAITTAANKQFLPASIELLKASQSHWIDNGLLHPLHRTTRHLKNKKYTAPEQRAIILEMSGDVLCRLNIDHEALSDLLECQKLAHQLQDYRMYIRSFYLLRNRRPKTEWIDQFGRITRLAHSKNVGIIDMLQTSCETFQSLGLNYSDNLLYGINLTLKNKNPYTLLIFFTYLDTNNPATKNLITQSIQWAKSISLPTSVIALEQRLAEMWITHHNITESRRAFQRMIAFSHSHGHQSGITEGTLGLAQCDLSEFDQHSLHAINSTLNGITSSQHQKNNTLQTEIDLLKEEALYRNTNFKSGKIDLSISNVERLTSCARSEMSLPTFLRCKLLKVIYLLQNHSVDEAGYREGSAVWGRVRSTLEFNPSLEAPDALRIERWMTEVLGLTPPSENNHQPFDLRPALWRATDTMPKKLVSRDNTQMALIPPGCYPVSPWEKEHRAMAQERPAWVPEDVWTSWQEVARNMPQPSEWLPGFYIDCHPVTWKQYMRYCKDQNLQPAVEPPPEALWMRPVTGLTHSEATDYAKWAGKVLPTGREWLAALRGLEGRRYPWGNDIGAVNVDVPMLQLPDISIHPLTTFDETRFSELIRGSLSLSVSEKLRVAYAVPTLSQFQVDELFKVFEDELLEFKKLEPTEGKIIESLKRKRDAEDPFFANYAPRDIMTIKGDNTPEGVRDLVGSVKEWLAESEAIDPKQWVIAGLLPAQDLLKDFDPTSLPEARVRTTAVNERQADATIGFRCIIPLTDEVPLPTEVQQAIDRVRLETDH